MIIEIILSFINCICLKAINLSSDIANYFIIHLSRLTNTVALALAICQLSSLFLLFGENMKLKKEMKFKNTSSVPTTSETFLSAVNFEVLDLKRIVSVGN